MREERKEGGSSETKQEIRRNEIEGEKMDTTLGRISKP